MNRRGFFGSVAAWLGVGAVATAAMSDPRADVCIYETSHEEWLTFPGLKLYMTTASDPSDVHWLIERHADGRPAQACDLAPGDEWRYCLPEG